jgi:PAS domain S-box-containing protein
VPDHHAPTLAPPGPADGAVPAGRSASASAAAAPWAAGSPVAALAGPNADRPRPGGRWSTAFAALDDAVETVLDELPVSLAVCDTTGRLIEVNDACCRMFASTRDDLLSTPVHALCLPDEVPATRELERSLLLGTIPRYRLERRFVTAHGEVRRGLFSVTRVGRDRIVIQGVDVSNVVGHGLAPVHELWDAARFAAALERQVLRGRHFGESAVLLALDLGDLPSVPQPAPGTSARRGRQHAIREAFTAARGPLDLAAALEPRRWALLRPQVAGADARAVADRFARAIERGSVVHRGDGPTFRVSVGAVLLGPATMDPSAVLAAARAAVLRARRTTGRFVLLGDRLLADRSA